MHNPHERKSLADAAHAKDTHAQAAPEPPAARTKRRATLAAFALLALLALVFAWRSMGGRSDPLRPEDVTYNRHSELTTNIARATISRGSLPESLDDVVRELGPTNGTIDGWKRPFVYERGEKGELKMSYSLRSLGEDGQANTDDDYVNDVTMIDDDDNVPRSAITESRRGK